MTKRERIHQLLRTRRYAVDPLQSGDPGGEFRGHQDGSRLLLMPNAYHAGCPDKCGHKGVTCTSPYRELDRCIAALKAQFPALAWHFEERYLRSTITERRFRKVGREYRRYKLSRALDPSHEVVLWDVIEPDRGKLAALFRQQGYTEKQIEKKIASAPVQSANRPIVFALVESWNPRACKNRAGLCLDLIVGGRWERKYPEIAFRGRAWLPKDVIEGLQEKEAAA